MIRIDVKTGEIVFAREGTESRRFLLLSGHACPECGLVVRAAWQSDSPVEVHRYEEPPAERPEDSRYQTEHRDRVQVLMAGHRVREARRLGIGPPPCCRFLAYTLPTLRGSLAAMLTDELGVRVWPDRVDADRATEAPGLRLVPDVTGASEPVVLYDPREFARALSPGEMAGGVPRSTVQARLLAVTGYQGSFLPTDEEEDC